MIAVVLTIAGAVLSGFGAYLHRVDLSALGILVIVAGVVLAFFNARKAKR